ncbi:TetR/AcrR family transcriptional regulator [Porticoccaceae bacterium]|jgi:AcrR family transcriptional regulator|nr:TetR/AcrR family transcriptional regulator [Porticoccaceae bacterium]MDA8598745.1 TetR/AcrR family transcriptional regulator [Porticoccaceae bacterium]MDB2395366.1 TetR/AcrR family transcriptional regulator [Porticoccaceae bacterium]|tara:strand:- start:131 stop:748 length:618 start_codon:yes stop_codon:yes gene_type:complete
MDLRQINKANRQKQVIANAARFFSSIGYDLTTIEMVAERSNMSPATIYNNFENKIGLLLAVLIEEGEEVQRIGEQLIAQRKQTDVRIIYRLIELYVDHPMEFMNKSCWRQALAASTASSNKKFTREYQNVDKRLKNQLIDLMHALQKEHTFVSQVDPGSLGAIIWNNVDQMFTDFISSEGMTLNELKSTINRQTSSLVNLALNLK